jgi:hypothetical protein
VATHHKITDRQRRNIIARYRAGESLVSLMRFYRIGYDAIHSILQEIPAEERGKILHEKHVRQGKKNGFRADHAPWNKGKVGWCPPGSKATQFKPGGIRGQAARNYKPVGTIVVRRDKKKSRVGRPAKGSLKLRRWLKVTDWGRPQDRWLPYALYLYERNVGPIPPGKFVVHADGDTLNDSLANLILVDRGEHMKRMDVYSPGSVARARQAASKAALARHETNRRIKEVRPADVKRNSPTAWFCPGCGFVIETSRRPDQCPKCLGSSFEKIEIASRVA